MNVATGGRLSVTPHLLISVVGWIVSQAVAFGILSPGVAQTVIAVGGIVLPAVWGVGSALHLGLVHAAVVKSSTPVKP